MNKDLQVFNFNGENVRTVVKDGEGWFVAKDVCDVLGYAKSRNAISYHVDSEDALSEGVTDNLGRIQQTTIINESGLYDLIFGSKLPEAKQFKRWVTKEVLPAIRKTGKYEMAQAQPSYQIDDPIERAKQWIIEQEETQQLKLTITEQAPKVETYNTFIDANGLYNMANLAKHLGTGRNKMLKLLRDKDVLQDGGFNHNIPYQTFVDRGYFAVKTKTTKVGNVQVTLATTKGAEWISKKLVEWENQKAA